MKIYLSPQTVSRWGGSLNGNLLHFDRLIQSELDASGFRSSFEECKLSILYPSLYPPNENEGERTKGFQNYYDSLPSVRMLRKENKIELALKAPAFAEHFNEPASPDRADRIEVEEKYKDLSDTALANILLDTYAEAATLIKARLKKGETFDADIFLQVLDKIRPGITTDFLIANKEEKAKEREHNRVEQAESIRSERKLEDQANFQMIRDIRLNYAYNFPAKLFYLNRFADIVLSKLIEKDFQCPGYHHLYISIADSKEDALKKAYVLENWYTYGVAVLNGRQLLNADPVEQQSLVLAAIREGLLDIATKDGLDQAKIEEAIKEAEEHGVLSERIVKTKSNNRITFVISIKVVPELNEEEVFFYIVDNKTEKVARWKFGQENIFIVGAWFGTINVTNKKITIKPRPNMDLVLAGRQMVTVLDVEQELADPARLISETPGIDLKEI